MMAPPTSWMILPPGCMALAPSDSTLPCTRPPIASMICAKVACMWAAWRVSCSDHFAAAAEAHERAVVAAHVFLELASVAAAGEPLESGSGPHAGHEATTAKLDVITACEAELGGLLIQPPRRIQV